ncbi:MAG: hypothetical protein AB2392_21965 [Neobacillus sp.]
MVDLIRKEGICGLKLKAIRILIQLVDDEQYTKEKQIEDLTSLISDLDQMEDEIQPICID